MTTGESVLTVATLNCLHGMNLRNARTGSGFTRSVSTKDLEVLATTLDALDADVIALQEVDRGLARSGHVHQMAWLGDRLGRHSAFAPALIGDPDDTWEPVPFADPQTPGYGVGLLSRYPFVHTTRQALPGGGAGSRAPLSTSDVMTGSVTNLNPGWDREPRVALRATISIDDQMVAVTTTHLSYLPWRALRQLRHSARFARRGPAYRPDTLPTVLLGDFNLPVTAVRACLPTWHHAGAGPTYPLGQERLQVDHVTAAGAAKIRHVHTTDATTSDHRAVVAVLEIGRSRQQV